MGGCADKSNSELRWIGKWTRVSRHDPGDHLDDVGILGDVTRRYWFTSDGLGGYWLSKVEGPTGTVTVRGADATIPYDGVWLNGKRSPDTWVLINGAASYHAPALPLSQWSFEQHEARGGGHAIP